MLGEGLVDQPRQVDRPQKARAIGRQWLFAARISGVDGLAVMEVVLGVDAVDEDDAGLGSCVAAVQGRLALVPRCGDKAVLSLSNLGIHRRSARLCARTARGLRRTPLPHP